MHSKEKVIAHPLVWIAVLLFGCRWMEAQPGPADTLDVLRQRWEAEWISHPTVSLTAYGVFYFRRRFALEERPETFVVHISADNRYELFVNERRVMLGPSWGDQLNWRFASLDLAPYLREGTNVVSVQVVNFGHLRAVAQHSYKTSLIVQGGDREAAVINTHPDRWEVIQDPAYRPIKVDWRTIVGGYYAANPTDTFEVARHLPQWAGVENDYRWLRPERPELTATGTPRPAGHDFGDQSPWLLVPRGIPSLEESHHYLAEVERAGGTDLPPGFLRGDGPLTVPPHSRAVILLDNRVHTRGFPEYFFSGGRGAVLKATYAEALYDADERKGHRDSTTGKEIIGYHDVVLPDGGAGRKYRPLWYRVFRYLQLEIQTEEETLTLDSLHLIYTAYPYRLKAEFATEDSVHARLFDAGWRTLRNATAEVFEDGPYYEQLMYAGDARVESLVSLVLSGDERMSKNALELFDASRMPNGLTYSRYPSNIPQINPQYALAWVQTIHDFMMYSDQPAWTERYLDGIAGVLEWHLKLVDSSGMLGVVPWLKHIENRSGTPRHPERGHSAQQSLFLALTLDMAEEIFTFHGRPGAAKRYTEAARRLKRATFEKCWDPTKQLMADSPEREVFTQHANVLTILTDAIPPPRQPELMRRVLQDTSLVQALLFFRFWSFQALEKTGLGPTFLDQLKPWKTVLAHGLTTFPEFDVESRSDCHPWGTHINYFMLHTVAGIRSDGFGFPSVTVAPEPGRQRYIRAAMAHPEGSISLTLDLRPAHPFAEIVLPGRLRGVFEWGGQRYPLVPGKQRIAL